MAESIRIVAPGPAERQVRTADGTLLTAPSDWHLLPPGDAALTRRVKAAGPHWIVQQKKGRKTFSLGVWAPADRIAAIQADLVAERSAPGYARRRAADAARRQQAQEGYVEDFRGAVLSFLRFAPPLTDLAERLADAVTRHATPVGSGTVARTKRIPLQQRVEAAVIAWLRHQTTHYDQMKIPRVKGSRRHVRRLLAEQSRVLLDGYRSGAAMQGADCPLRRALDAENVVVTSEALSSS